MHLVQLKSLFAARLEPLYGRREAAAIFSLAVEKLTGLTRTEMALDPDRELPAEQQGEAHRMLDRLAAGEPVQYALGATEFCGCVLSVGEGVLIPRPETEELVRLIVEDLAGGPAVSVGAPGLAILDIGTGSGAIAIALARLAPGARVVGVDISDRALEFARANSAANEVDVDFRKADILDPAVLEGEKCDIIVSNPPYVLLSERAAMARNVVDFEPHEALFVDDDDPLVFYRAIARFAVGALRPGGGLYFEINEKFGKEVAHVVEEFGFEEISVIKDISSKDRIVRCRKPW